MTRRNKNVDKFIRQVKQRTRPRAPSISGILSELWGNIIADLDITGQRWDNHMNIYVRNETEKLAQMGNRVDRTSIRGNLAKELLRHYMSWKVFFKGLKFLRWKAFKIVIIGMHENGTVSEHSVTVDMTAMAGLREDENHGDTTNAQDSSPVTAAALESEHEQRKNNANDFI